MEQNKNTEDCYDVAELMAIWKINKSAVCRKINKYFPSAFKVNNKWYVPKKDVVLYNKNTNEYLGNSEQNLYTTNEQLEIMKTDYYTIDELLKIWKCSRRVCLKRAKELGCIKVNNNRLYTPKKNVDKWNEEREEGIKKLEQLIKR